MESVKQPEPLNEEGNLDHNWRAFKQRYNLHTVAIGADHFPDDSKVALFLTVGGQSAVDIFNAFDLTVAARKYMQKSLKSLINFAPPRKMKLM